MKRVLCVGMMVCDTLLFPVPADVLERDSVSIQTPVTSCGGDALNVAMALSRLGVETAVCGRVGRDKNGDYIQAACREAKIDTSGITIDLECGTAASYALIDLDGERHFLSDRKIFHRLTDADVPDHLLDWADIVYMGSALAMEQMNAGGLERLFQRAKARGKITVMDAALSDATVPDSWLEQLKPVLTYTDVFFPSREEAQSITGMQELETILECFRGLGLRAFGVKLGADGCVVTDFRRTEHIAAVPDIKVVDTCGAGDSFVAGFLQGMLQGWDVFSCAKLGSCVAALNVQAVGGTGGVPTFDSALAYYHKIYPTN